MSKTSPPVDAICYSIAETAALLRVSTRTMYEIAKQKGFPAVQISPNRKVVPKAALEAWLEQQISNQ